MSSSFKDTVSILGIYNYYKKKYDTVCSIINVASVNCAKIKQLALGLIIISITFIFSLIFSYQNIANDGCINENYIKKVVTGFLICIIILTFSFLAFNYIYFKRQAVYRELKKKIEIDIVAKNLGDSIYNRNRYYDLIKNQIQKNIIHNHTFLLKLVKETILYWIFIFCFCIAIVLINCLMGV